MRFNRSHACGWLLLVCGLGAATPASADIVSWRAGVSGEWTDATKWMPARVPGAADDVELKHPGAIYTVSVTRTAAARSLAIGSRVHFALDDKKVTVGGPGTAFRVEDTFGDFTMGGATLGVTNDASIDGRMGVFGGRFRVGGTLTVRRALSVGSNLDGERVLSALDTNRTIIGPASDGFLPFPAVLELGDEALWRARGTIEVGQVDLDDGAARGGLYVHDDAKVNARGQDILVGPHGVLKVAKSATVLGRQRKVSIKSGRIVIDGVVASGRSPGVADFEVSDLFHLTSSGAVEVELGGLEMGTEYDRIRVFGHTLLQGHMDLHLVDGFTPQPGDRFRIFQSTTLSGEFDGLSNGSVFNHDGVDFRIRYHAAAPMSSVTLRAVPAPGGCALLGLVALASLRRRR